MARSALLCALPALLIATGWRQLESAGQGRGFAAVAALAVAVALVPRGWLRLVAAGGASLATLQLAFGLRPVGGIFTEFLSGVVDFYEVALPFAPVDHERMHGVLVVAVFAFTLGMSLAVAGRRAILAAAFTLAGAAWPVTLIRDAPTTARATLLLVSALVLLAALRPGLRPGAKQTALVGAGVVVAALIAVSSPAVAKGGFLNWEQWEPYKRAEKSVSVSYAWDANYDGIRFPKTSTTVLTIKAPARAPYWRATTLDVFFDDRWRQLQVPIQAEDRRGRDALLDDSLLPPRAFGERNWMRQEVRVRALRDTHLVAATVPIAYERGVATAYSAGVGHVNRLRRGQEYEVWSYVERPRPGQLARSRPSYPDAARGFLETPAGFAPPFGAEGREAQMSRLLQGRFGDPRYNDLYDIARQVVGRPQNPYAAVIALEAWFRSSGSFTYDETPPVRRRTPPLVSFVTGHRRGYCQHFAGAMALMLRYLGIPARVGAGFTTGRYNQDRGEYTVSDTNAHTWVEAWFSGYGWLPFDPTPGRGRLLSSYTSSSTFFNASEATRALVGVSAAALGLQALQSRLESAERGQGDQSGAADVAGAGQGGARDGSGGGLRDSLLFLLLLATVTLVGAMWTLKTVRRRARYLTRDPRRLAAAVRLELADFLVDQRLPVSANSTPAEVGEELERSVGIPAYRLAEALAEARYGPESEAEAAARRARNELRAVRAAIRRRLGAGEKLRGLLSLRSLGLGSS